MTLTVSLLMSGGDALPYLVQGGGVAAHLREVSSVKRARAARSDSSVPPGAKSDRGMSKAAARSAPRLPPRLTMVSVGSPPAQCITLLRHAFRKDQALHRINCSPADSSAEVRNHCIIQWCLH